MAFTICAAAPTRVIGQTIAIHAGKWVVRRPGVPNEQMLRVHLGSGLAQNYADWSGTGRRDPGGHRPGGQQPFHDRDTIAPTQDGRSSCVESNMPTVLIVGRYLFVICIKELDFESPHVRIGN